MQWIPTSILPQGLEPFLNVGCNDSGCNTCNAHAEYTLTMPANQQGESLQAALRRLLCGTDRTTLLVNLLGGAACAYVIVDEYWQVICTQDLPALHGGATLARHTMTCYTCASEQEVVDVLSMLQALAHD